MPPTNTGKQSCLASTLQVLPVDISIPLSLSSTAFIENFHGGSSLYMLLHRRWVVSVVLLSFLGTTSLLFKHMKVDLGYCKLTISFVYCGFGIAIYLRKRFLSLRRKSVEFITPVESSLITHTKQDRPRILRNGHSRRLLHLPPTLHDANRDVLQ